MGKKKRGYRKKEPAVANSPTPRSTQTPHGDPFADIFPRCCHCQPCYAVNNPPLKRHCSPSSSLTFKKLSETPHADPSADVLPRCCHCQPCSTVNNQLSSSLTFKKFLSDSPHPIPTHTPHTDPTLSLHGYTPVPIPFNIDLHPSRTSAPTPLTPVDRGSGLPPLPSLISENTAGPVSVVNQEPEKEGSADQDNNVLDEGVHVEWNKKLVSIKFECPSCAKVFEVIFSETNCYYKVL